MACIARTLFQLSKTNTINGIENPLIKMYISSLYHVYFVHFVSVSTVSFALAYNLHFVRALHTMILYLFWFFCLLFFLSSLVFVLCCAAVVNKILREYQYNQHMGVVKVYILHKAIKRITKR